MPFEVVRVPDGTKLRFLKGYISDGQALMVDDYTNGRAEIVSIVCHSDEDGGEIYRFPEEELATDKPDRANFMGLEPPKNNIESIHPGTTYTLDRVDFAGNKERVIYKHMAPFVMRAFDDPDIIYTQSMN